MSVSQRGLYVGIDVVDALDDRCARLGADQRFLRRILAHSERDALGSAPDAMELWRVWAAKEAAYKVASKLRGAPPPFVHAAFEVDPPHGRAEDGFGTVTWDGVRLGIHWHEDRERVAALAWDGMAPDEPVEWGWAAAADVDPDPEASLADLLEGFTPRERRPVYSRPSALVRIAARRALADALRVEEARVEVVCGEGPRGRTPPEVLLDGEPAPADVSLSHHGRWLAWAVRLAEPHPLEGDGGDEQG